MTHVSVGCCFLSLACDICGVAQAAGTGHAAPETLPVVPADVIAPPHCTSTDVLSHLFSHVPETTGNLRQQSACSVTHRVTVSFTAAEERKKGRKKEGKKRGRDVSSSLAAVM